MKNSHFVIVVLAKAPHAGACKSRLARVLGEENAAKLFGAMLRDTLDGLLDIPAARYIVAAAPEDDGARVLERVVPAPWDVELQVGDDLSARRAHAFATAFENGATHVLVCDSDSPTASTEAISRAINEDADVIRGPTTRDATDLYALGLSRAAHEAVGANASASTPEGMRAIDLPPALDVSEPEDVDALAMELRAHPETGPRSADFFVKMEWGPVPK